MRNTDIVHSAWEAVALVAKDAPELVLAATMMAEAAEAGRRSAASGLAAGLLRAVEGGAKIRPVARVHLAIALQRVAKPY